jgi:hybrid cluster-associated redox disulfide protein
MAKKPKITLRQAQGNPERSRRITKEMRISEVIKKYPKTIFVFLDCDLHCIGCPAAQDETIEEAAKIHLLDLNKLLSDLNKASL